MFQKAHELGLFTVLWCYLRNPAFKTKDADYHLAADLTGQANHLGVTLGADIIKQKLPENNGGYNAVNFGKTHKAVYSQLTSDNPIDLTRYQLANCYMGRSPLINSGGASSGESDLKEAIRTAVINKRAGGTGLISGRKAFQRPDERRGCAPQGNPGRLPREGRDGRLEGSLTCWSQVSCSRRFQRCSRCRPVVATASMRRLRPCPAHVLLSARWESRGSPRGTRTRTSGTADRG